MKRGELIRHLRKCGCAFSREGAKHTMFVNPKIGEEVAVPRHDEINTLTAWDICKALKIEKPKGK